MSSRRFILKALPFLGAILAVPSIMAKPIPVIVGVDVGAGGAVAIAITSGLGES